MGVSGLGTPATGTRQKGSTISRDLRINQMIRVPNVRVVDEEGNQLGVMHTMDAVRLAQERGFDLVEVAPLASPPVARLLDFGQYKYELTKREKEAKRRQRSVSFKEVRLKPKIGQGDFDTKVRRAIDFLEEGDRVKVSVQFRGRELTHPQIGRDLLDKFAEQIKEHGMVERAPLLEGKSMSISIASTHKPKPHEPQPVHEAKARGKHEAERPAEAGGTAEGAEAQAAEAPAAQPQVGQAAEPVQPAPSEGADVVAAPAEPQAPAQASAPEQPTDQSSEQPEQPQAEAPKRPVRAATSRTRAARPAGDAGAAATGE